MGWSLHELSRPLTGLGRGFPVHGLVMSWAVHGLNWAWSGLFIVWVGRYAGFWYELVCAWTQLVISRSGHALAWEWVGWARAVIGKVRSLHGLG